MQSLRNMSEADKVWLRGEIRSVIREETGNDATEGLADTSETEIEQGEETYKLGLACQNCGHEWEQKIPVGTDFCSNTPGFGVRHFRTICPNCGSFKVDRAAEQLERERCVHRDIREGIRELKNRLHRREGFRGQQFSSHWCLSLNDVYEEIDKWLAEIEAAGKER